MSVKHLFYIAPTARATLLVVSLLLAGTALIPKPERNSAGGRNSGPDGVAVLLNNDPSPRHQANLTMAYEALMNWGVERIICLGDGSEPPRLAEVLQTFEDIRRDGDFVGLFYLTGHGALLHSSGREHGEACVMLRDRPLTASRLADLLGSGPATVYLDQCYAPGFIETLTLHLNGDFLLLTDKNTDNPQTSCRDISTALWDHLASRAGQAPFRDSIYAAWQETCPGGTCRQLVSRDSSLSLSVNYDISNP